MKNQTPPFASSQHEKPSAENETYIVRRPFNPVEPLSEQSLKELEALDGLDDEDIDYSDISPLPDDFFQNAVRGWLPLEKHTVDLALDAEVYDWLMREGLKNPRVINHVLRREMQQAAAPNKHMAPAPPVSPTMSKAS